MRWLLASVVACLAVAIAPTLDAVAAPPAPLERTHELAVAPVAGTMQRAFAPPPTRYGAGHRGVDLAAAPGEPVVAAIGGVVTFSGAVSHVGWVTVDHGGGLNTTYGPVDPRVVVAGDRVDRGGLLGFVADGAAHLDWGARLEGEYIDPLALLQPWEAYLTTDTTASDRALLAAADTLDVAESATPSRRFVKPADGPITSTFGPRRHPVTGEHRHHAGMDIGAPAGAPVRAAAAGVVSFAGTASGYGSTVIVDHGGGLTTLYAHLSTTAVRTGQSVPAAGRLGAVGSTGLVTGPHLHFEVRSGGVAQDPRRWL